jgi:hypothetical protein
MFIHAIMFGCDVEITIDDKTVEIGIDSCQGIYVPVSTTLDEVGHIVETRINMMRDAQMRYIASLPRICDACGKDKNWDDSACACPGCCSFSERRPCQYLCHCAE